ncbi:TPA: hypothetical protein ACF4E7_004602 [Vibrio parahaemolyticus]|nr:hypothetical protein [Vibrio parahaemolyticus]HCE1970497.1 hypothetical protein [Vibrio parahaemolyticus]HCE3678953.1 hypothetical protein [Vibrio parahaemolyticus]
MEKVLFVILGFVLAFIPKWLDRKRKIKAHWLAITSEVSRIEAKTEMLLSAGIDSPLYRLPVKCYETSFSMLLTEGVVTQTEVHALEDFYDLVQDINRGLDQVAAACASDDEPGIDAESNRNFGKAKELIRGEKALIKKVKLIVEAKSALPLIRY